MILCRIESGQVINRAVFDGAVPDGWIQPGETWIASDVAQIGWAYDGTFHPPPAPPAPPVGPDTNNYSAMIRRRAKALGPSYASLQLLKSIGE